jgi:hypothetical protein
MSLYTPEEIVKINTFENTILHEGYEIERIYRNELGQVCIQLKDIIL